MIDKSASLVYELRQHEFFADMPDDAIKELIGLTQTKLVKSRQTIFSQGDEGDSLYVILSGAIKISTTSNAGKETVLAFMGAGDVLGEIAVLDGDVRTATATVLDEARVLVLRQAAFLGFLERQPKMALHIIRVLCNRLRKTDAFVEEMTTLQAGPRLARALLRLADQYGKETATGSLKLDVKISQANLGAHAGLMRENVNRQLKLWEDEGLLESKGGAIELLKPDLLRETAEQAS